MTDTARSLKLTNVLATRRPHSMKYLCLHAHPAPWAGLNPDTKRSIFNYPRDEYIDRQQKTNVFTDNTVVERIRLSKHLWNVGVSFKIGMYLCRRQLT